jgi:thiazole/oxazole-forming peptide maturase SagD family component
MIFCQVSFAGAHRMINNWNETPAQAILGVPDDAGAAFLFDDEIKVIGGPTDCEWVLLLARLCDGTRTAEEIVAAAQARGIPSEPADTILTTLFAEGILQAAGAASLHTDLGDLQRANRLLAQFVGEGKLVSRLDVYRPGLDEDNTTLFAYFAANGQFAYSNGKPYTCHGSAPTPAGAVLKAVGEAVERYYNGAEIRIDAFSPAQHLAHPALVFEAVTRQRPEYLAEKGLLSFAPEDKHPWVLAHYLGSQAPVYLLADAVYYPVTAAQLGRPKVAEPNASGSAAHFARDEAVKRGLLELIERDALAVTWYSRRPVTAIPSELAPPEIQKQLAYWSGLGREFRLLNLTLDSVPVVLALSEADRYPFITAGCAAAETFSAAMVKAFFESEMIALSWAATQEALPALSASLSPAGHGLLYAHPGNQHRMDWLLEAPTAEPVEASIGMADLIRHFDPIVVDLHTPQSAADLWVVKVFSDRVLPITFGYKSEPHGHSRLSELGLHWGSYPSYPHFLA